MLVDWRYEMKALIGYTGFVSGNLEGNQYDAKYNSKNMAHHQNLCLTA